MPETNSSEADGDELTITEEQLAALAGSAKEDSYLRFLIARAQLGQDTQVVILTNGMMLTGRLTTGRAMAEHLDGQTEILLQYANKPEDQSDEDWETQKEKGSTLLRESFDETSALEDELDQAAANDAEPMSPDDQVTRKVLRAHPYVTLKNVQITSPSQSGVTHVKVMRVPVSGINGWWVPDVRIDENGQLVASFNFWE